MGKKRRPSLRRLLAVLVALLLIWLLWNLNAFLPGVWPGGGGGGAISAPQPRTATTDAAAPTRTSTDARDAGAVAAGNAPTWQRDGVAVEVRLPGGDATDQWNMGIGDGGPEQKPRADGRLQATDRAIFREGFRVRAETGLVRHHFGTRHPASTWAVYLPSRKLTRERRHASPVQVEVVAAKTAAPIAGIDVTAVDPASLRPAVRVRTDAQGKVSIKGARSVVRVSVDGNDAVGNRWIGDAWADPRGPAPVRLTARPATPIQVSWEPDPAVRVLRARWKTGSGHVLSAARPSHETATSLRLPRPPRTPADGWVELTLTSKKAPGATFARALPSDDAGVRFPALPVAQIAVAVFGPQGPLPRATLSGTYPPEHGAAEAAPLPSTTTTNANGEATLLLPAKTNARVLVEAAGMAPAAIRLDGPGQGPTSVTLTPGGQHAVRVMDHKDRPVARATVLLRMSVDTLRVQRTARTDPDGVAVLNALPEGDAEILAHATGTAWSATAVPVGSEETKLVLRRGANLALVVATPEGFPVAGAHAEVVSQTSKAPVLVDPRMRTLESNERGELLVPDLPVERYRVRLSAPGYRSATIHGATPGDTTHFVTLVPHDSSTTNR